jgi:hypothetical protein
LLAPLSLTQSRLISLVTANTRQSLSRSFLVADLRILVPRAACLAGVAAGVPPRVVNANNIANLNRRSLGPHPVISVQGQFVDPLTQTGLGPGAQTAADRPVRAGPGRHSFVAGAVHQSRDDVLEHDPVRDPSAVATKRMSWIGCVRRAARGRRFAGVIN